MYEHTYLHHYVLREHTHLRLDALKVIGQQNYFFIYTALSKKELPVAVFNWPDIWLAA